MNDLYRSIGEIVMEVEARAIQRRKRIAMLIAPIIGVATNYLFDVKSFSVKWVIMPFIVVFVVYPLVYWLLKCWSKMREESEFHRNFVEDEVPKLSAIADAFRVAGKLPDGYFSFSMADSDRQHLQKIGILKILETIEQECNKRDVRK